MQETKQSVLTIENQNKISMTGVGAVDSFSDTVIVLAVNGKRVQIAGTGLKVLSFSEGSGNFAASGQVHSVKYGERGGGLKKLLKS